MMRAKVIALVFAGLAFAVAFGTPARAAEQILSYRSDIRVEESGALDVTEMIEVVAEGRAIKRGIYRDFPTRYSEPSGLIRTAGFDLLEVTRDGEPEPYRTEGVSGGVRIYIGDPDVFLRAGTYTYTIRYRTTRQLRFFEDYDELYWNVTGNFWRFPIRSASARVVLPDAARIISRAAYTGPIGSKESAVTIEREADNVISFATTRPLGTGEGLTVAVAFPKGVVEEPSGTWRLVRRVIDNFGLVFLVFGFIAVIVYFRWAWKRFGVDPPSGTIIPLFHPPEELTPAGVSYLYYRGFKRKRGVSKAFLAGLVKLAVDRRIHINDAADTITVRRGERPDGAMGPGELRIFNTLLGRRQSITFDKANGKTVATALSQFDSAIEAAFGNGLYFTHNFGWFVIGALLSVLTVIGFIVLAAPGEEIAALIMPVAMFAVTGTSMLASGLRRFRGSVPGGSILIGIVMFIIGLIFSLPTIGLSLFAFDGIIAIVPLVAVALASINVVFFFLMPAPTVAGRRLMDEIEGFRMYLETAESERMNLIDAPEMSVELFERFLPHAVGLGVEEPWSEAYESHIARALPDRQSGYSPHWYSGSRWNSSSIACSTSAVTNAVASGMASAVPSSSGSSGSFGGGSSGGGGGGGGGGGW